MRSGIELDSEEQQVRFGERLARLLPKVAVVFLEGDLGAGKTTLVRGVLRGLGWGGNVKSPTYTIVEPYELDEVNLYHFDLYRLADPEELEYLGLREMLGHGMLFFEWPERGEGFLPQPDCVIRIAHKQQGRALTIETADPGLQQQLDAAIREF
jgi:tRNA threonylcarbamoyladenosine biosynthesis protein TsaE